MFSLIAAGVAAAAGVASSAASAISQANANAITEEQWERSFAYQKDQDILSRQWANEQFYAGQAFNKELYNQSVKDNIAQWERENEYNKPVNQVNRLMEAGLNPVTFMSNGSNITGNAANMSVANPVSSPSSGTSFSSGAPSLPHYQAMNLNGLSTDLSNAFNNILKSKELEIQKSRTNAQNAVDFARVDEVKANTRAIQNGDVRAQELHTSQLVEAQQSAINREKEGLSIDATIENIKVRSEAMLMNSQKVYSDMLALGIQMEQNRFGQNIQAAGLTVQAKKVQAEVAAMSLSQLISYSKEFGVLKSGAWSHSSTDSDTAEGHLGFDAGAKISNGFRAAKSFFGSLTGGGSYSDTDSNTESNQSTETYREIREETLKPMVAAIRCLDEITKDPLNVELGRAAERLSQYINTTSSFALKNLLLLQGQINRISENVLNPSNKDTFNQ